MSTFLLTLTGGALNENPMLSLGGAASSAQVLDNVHAILEPVEEPYASAGRTDYRAIAITWTGAVSTTGVRVWFEELAVNTALYIGADDGLAQTIPSRTSAPAGITFSQPATKGAGADLGTFAGGETKLLWFKRVVVEDEGQLLETEVFVLSVEADQSITIGPLPPYQMFRVRYQIERQSSEEVSLPSKEVFIGLSGVSLPVDKYLGMIWQSLPSSDLCRQAAEAAFSSFRSRDVFEGPIEVSVHSRDAFAGFTHQGLPAADIFEAILWLSDPSADFFAAPSVFGSLSSNDVFIGVDYASLHGGDHGEALLYPALPCQDLFFGPNEDAEISEPSNEVVFGRIVRGNRRRKFVVMEV